MLHHFFQICGKRAKFPDARCRDLTVMQKIFIFITQILSLMACNYTRPDCIRGFILLFLRQIVKRQRFSPYKQINPVYERL